LSEQASSFFRQWIKVKKGEPKRGRPCLAEGKRFGCKPNGEPMLAIALLQRGRGPIATRAAIAAPNCGQWFAMQIRRVGDRLGL
jgi:hypothetical protein